MSKFETTLSELRDQPAAWLVTGAAGFIGSNLIETLLRNGQRVTGLDSFATGHQRNLDEVRRLVGESAWSKFSFIEGDIRDPQTCAGAVAKADYVLHQGALGSVPRSIEDPMATHEVNLTGTLNMLTAARDARVKRIVYASSSALYGDHPGLPKVEDRIGAPLSPYAASKLGNELYAEVFARCYGLNSVGLRYFNVFGPRQDPDGPYAAVIPKWIAALLTGETVFINGDGETSRDFCFVDNVVQANILCALASMESGKHRAFNVAVGERTTLNELFGFLRDRLAKRPGLERLKEMTPTYRDFRAGDVRHSLADTSAIREFAGYAPTHNVDQGINKALDWYVADFERQTANS